MNVVLALKNRFGPLNCIGPLSDSIDDSIRAQCLFLVDLFNSGSPLLIHDHSVRWFGYRSHRAYNNCRSARNRQADQAGGENGFQLGQSCFLIHHTLLHGVS